MRTRPGLAAALLASGLLLGTPGGGRVAAQAPDEFKAVMQIETADQPTMQMEYYLGPQRMRMDLAQGMSVIWFSGDAPRMLMVQHAEQRYIRWGPEQLKMMQRMLQRMQTQGANGSAEVDVSRLSFEETGRREQIGEWDAFEVRVTGMDDEAAAFWMTTDIDLGLFEVSQHVAEAADALRMPMAGGAAAGSQQLLQYQSFLDAQGLPDARVVRMNIDAEGQPTTIALLSMDPGPLPPDTFDPPAGYEQMQMPSIPGGFPGE